MTNKTHAIIGLTLGALTAGLLILIISSVAATNQVYDPEEMLYFDEEPYDE